MSEPMDEVVFNGCGVDRTFTVTFYVALTSYAQVCSPNEDEHLLDCGYPSGSSFQTIPTDSEEPGWNGRAAPIGQ